MSEVDTVLAGDSWAARAFYAVVRGVCVAFCRIWFRMTVEGLENVPRSGPFVLAPVHRSNMDTPIVCVVTRRRLRYMGKDTLWKKAFPRWFLSALGGFPVTRGSADKEALVRCIAVLRGGEPLVLFPEGERKSGPLVQPLFDGAAFVAAKAAAPIVPVGIGGSESVMPKGSKYIHPSKVHVVVGRPIEVPGADRGRVPRADLAQVTKVLHEELQRLFDRGGRHASRPEPAVRGRVWGVPLAVWALWQALLVLTGARFSTALLDISWQIVPIETLRRDPLGSVWYLHIQPPLWNLALGLVTRLSPLSDALSLQLILLACSALVVVLLADLLRLMRFPPWACMASASVVALDPELVRYAYEPAYEVPTAMLVVLVVWCGVRLVERSTTARWLALCGAATALVLTRSIFHPVWLAVVLVTIAAALHRRLGWRATVAGFALPVVLVGGWALKNQALFGEATLSSWSGMNLQRAVIPPLPLADLDALAADGTLSGVAVVGPFQSYDSYAGAVSPCTPSHDHPSVDEPARANGVPNFNYECYIPVYRQAGHDAWAVAVHRPGTWWRGRAWGARATFIEGKGSSPDSAAFRASQAAFRVLTVATPGALGWEGWGHPLFGPAPVQVRYLWAVLAGAAFLLGRGAVGAVRLWRRRGSAATEAGWAMAAAMALYTLAVGIVAELGEQFRFRPGVEPLIVGLPLALALSAVPALVARVRGQAPAK